MNIMLTETYKYHTLLAIVVEQGSELIWRRVFDCKLLLARELPYGLAREGLLFAEKLPAGLARKASARLQFNCVRDTLASRDAIASSFRFHHSVSSSKCI
jgi:hypothetical protein